MPELPEVETIVRDLAHHLPGRTIVDVEITHADVIEGAGPAEFRGALVGRRIDRVTRRAKNIVLHLGEELLVVNLGMTGRLLVATAEDEEPSHVAVRMRLDDGRFLLYHDVRRFGRLQHFRPAAWAAWAERFGLEPLSEEFTPDALHALAQRSRVPIKTWLMDQRRVVGVGNIYASEALFRAEIDPRRPARDLTAAEVERLRHATIEVLQEAIRFRGTTFLDYRDAQGERGAFADRLRVYGRAGEPCATCGAPIERVVQAGRSTFFCAACQS